MKIYRWPQDGGIGVYCPECHEGLGAGNDIPSVAHLAHIHVVQVHDNVEWDWEDFKTQEEAMNAG